MPRNLLWFYTINVMLSIYTWSSEIAPSSRSMDFATDAVDPTTYDQAIRPRGWKLKCELTLHWIYQSKLLTWFLQSYKNADIHRHWNIFSIHWRLSWFHLFHSLTRYVVTTRVAVKVTWYVANVSVTKGSMVSIVSVTLMKRCHPVGTNQDVSRKDSIHITYSTTKWLDHHLNENFQSQNGDNIKIGAVYFEFPVWWRPCRLVIALRREIQSSGSCSSISIYYFWILTHVS